MFKKIFLLTVFSVIIFSNFVFAAADKVVVYYFYANPRCMTCKNIEKYTGETVKSLKRQDLTYQAVDLDNPKNYIYWKKYNLYTKSVVLSKVRNGKEIKYKNLNQIFIKAHNEKAFKSYIANEIKNF